MKSNLRFRSRAAACIETGVAVLLFAAIWLFMPKNVIAQTPNPACPLRIIQAIQGSGADTKVGYVCDSDCATRYYLTSGASFFKKEIVDTTTTGTNCQANTHVHNERTIRQGTTINRYRLLDRDSLTCVKHYTNETVNGTDATSISYDFQGFGCSCEPASDSCRSEWVDDDLIDGDWDCSFSVPSYAWVGPIHTEYETGSAGCVVTHVTDVYKYQDATTSSTYTIISNPSSDYQDEYDTATCIARAHECAKNELATQSFPGGGAAECTFNLSQAKDTASETVARWRVAISGGDPNKDYELGLIWDETINHVTHSWIEIVTIKGSQGYYPSESGQLLEPKEKEVCSYSYSKKLRATYIWGKP